MTESELASPDHTPRRRRRTRSAEKAQAILAAATREFMRRGYERAGMDAIAEEAGVSKQTIYNHYGSKEALFEAIVSLRSGRLLSPLHDPELSRRTPAEALRSLGRQFLDVVLDPSSLALYRVLTAEAGRFPALGRATYQQGPERSVATLARYLTDEHARGRLHVPDPILSAEQFFGMLMGHMQLRALLGVESRPAAARRERFIGHAVASFLEAHRPELRG
ncbi:MAG: TetR/AcrR family transcriptional regulator [Alphaproteobacteria bacterium]